MKVGVVNPLVSATVAVVGIPAPQREPLVAVGAVGGLNKVTVAVAEPVHPVVPFNPYTVYVVVALGVTVNTFPVVEEPFQV